MKTRNPVAKFVKRSGAGQHKSKFGNKVSRARFKHLVVAKKNLEQFLHQ
jgi:hypothetical protein